MEKDRLKNFLQEAEFVVWDIMYAMSCGSKYDWESANDQAVIVESAIEDFESKYGLKFPKTAEMVKRMIWSTDIERRDPLYESCIVTLLDFISELRENLKDQNIEILDKGLDKFWYLAHESCDVIRAGYKKKFDQCIKGVTYIEKYLKQVEEILGKKLENARRDLENIKVYAEMRRPSKIDDCCIGVMIETFKAIREAIQ
jgi:hypothetical protein